MFIFTYEIPTEECYLILKLDSIYAYFLNEEGAIIRTTYGYRHRVAL